MTKKEINALRRHIERSNALEDGEVHDRLKDADGWYNDNFMPSPSKESQTKRKQHGAKTLEHIGIKFVNQRQIIGTEPFPNFPGVVRGSPVQGSAEIPAKFAKSVTRGSPAQGSADIPAKFAKSVTRGSLPPPSAHQAVTLSQGLQPSQVPEGFRSGITTSRRPVAYSHVHPTYARAPWARRQ